MSEKRTRISLAQKLYIIEASKKLFSSELLFTLRPVECFMSELFFTLRATECAKNWVNISGFEPAQMKLDKEKNELDNCFFEPVSTIVVTSGKRKRK